MARVALRADRGAGILAAYAINELPDEARRVMLRRLVDAHRSGARVLVIEPIARSMARWWTSWQDAFGVEGGRADDWRFHVELPPRQRALARAAGLDPRELTARSLFLGPGGQDDSVTTHS
jgi:hypothetical protein